MTEVDAKKAADELLMLLDGLLQMGNEVSYVIECLSEDCRAEAGRGMKDAFDCLEKHPLPESWAEQIEAMLDEAVPPLNTRNLVLCSRKLYRLRRRLANQVACLLRVKSPYSEQLYPLFGKEGSYAS